MAPDIKAVFSDIDGTLYSHASKRVPVSAINAIRELQANGIKFFLCSGRNKYLIRKSGITAIVKPDGLVTMNGAQVILDDRIIYQYPIPESEVDILIKFAKRLRFGLTLIEETEGHINMIDERVIAAHEPYGTRFPQPRTFPDHYDRTIYQAIAFCDSFDESLFLPHLKKCKTARWDTYAVDIMPKDSDKAKGIMAVLEHFNWRPENIVVLGDALNDIEMMNFAGISVCMGNGRSEVKAYADYVTADIDDDGWAKAMKHYGLIAEVDRHDRNAADPNRG